MSFEELAARCRRGATTLLCAGLLGGCLASDREAQAQASSGSAMRASFYRDFVACQNAFDGASERGEPAAVRAETLFACTDALVAASERNPLELGLVDMLRARGHVELENYPAAREEIGRLIARPGTPSSQVRNARFMLAQLQYADADICGGLATMGTLLEIDADAIELFTGGFEALSETKMNTEDAVRLGLGACKAGDDDLALRAAYAVWKSSAAEDGPVTGANSNQPH